MMTRLLAAASAVSLLFAGLAFGAPARATLVLQGASIRGAHFHPRERVRVKITSASTTVHTVSANATGAFTFILSTAPDPCNEAFVVVATGATGDVARLKVMPRGCPPPGATP
jgi:hypothetical protein